jgi:hypothetical protein
MRGIANKPSSWEVVFALDEPIRILIRLKVGFLTGNGNAFM